MLSGSEVCHPGLHLSLSKVTKPEVSFAWCYWLFTSRTQQCEGAGGPAVFPML